MAQKCSGIFGDGLADKVRMRVGGNGETLFRLSDVCRVLGKSDCRHDIRMLKDCAARLPNNPIVYLNEVVREIRRKDGVVEYQSGNVCYITESALVLLIIRTHTPEAENFKVFLASMLPTVCKNQSVENIFLL